MVCSILMNIDHLVTEKWPNVPVKTELVAKSAFADVKVLVHWRILNFLMMPVPEPVRLGWQTHHGGFSQLPNSWFQMTQNRLEPANSLIAVLNELDESAELVLVIPSKKQTCLVGLICDSFRRLWYKFGGENPQEHREKERSCYELTSAWGFSSLIKC